MKSGLIIIAPLEEPLRGIVHALQRRFDPKMASLLPPHLTVTGSSGMGPISTKTTEAELRAALEPIAETTPPMSLPLGAPERLGEANVVALPLSPHGPLRELHDRIKMAGLLYEAPRFTFTPHITLNFFPELTPARLREMLAVRVTERAVIRRIQVHETLDLTRTRMVVEVGLGGRVGE